MVSVVPGENIQIHEFLLAEATMGFDAEKRYGYKFDIKILRRRVIAVFRVSTFSSGRL